MSFENNLLESIEYACQRELEASLMDMESTDYMAELTFNNPLAFSEYDFEEVAMQVDGAQAIRSIEAHEQGRQVIVLVHF
jgi:hypothetical protein